MLISGSLVRAQQAEPFFLKFFRKLVTRWVHWLGLSWAPGRILVGLRIVEILPVVDSGWCPNAMTYRPYQAISWLGIECAHITPDALRTNSTLIVLLSAMMRSPTMPTCASPTIRAGINLGNRLTHRCAWSTGIDATNRKRLRCTRSSSSTCGRLPMS